jgi:DNA-binding transcriptional LysR family regulator
LKGVFRSEREDWIQVMVAAGMGICFVPEYSATLPGVVIRPTVSPEVCRDVALVTVAGRRWSSPMEIFVRSVQRYAWDAADC